MCNIQSTPVPAQLALTKLIRQTKSVDYHHIILITTYTTIVAVIGVSVVFVIVVLVLVDERKREMMSDIRNDVASNTSRQGYVGRG
jgi:hypothetical protein